MTTELERLDENLHERPGEDAGPPKRYYFENLKISLPQVKLSVFTSHKLPPDLKVALPPRRKVCLITRLHEQHTNVVASDFNSFGSTLIFLQALKGTLGFPLVRFEDAVINMYPFTRVHPYETQEIIINDILKHFREVGSRGSE